MSFVIILKSLKQECIVYKKNYTPDNDDNVTYVIFKK